MGHRLSKIYTRTGDSGETGLADGSRVRKDSVRIQVMGDVDELNCALGLLLAQKLPTTFTIEAMLYSTQSLLFELGSELAVPDYQAIQQTDIDALEIHLDLMNADLPPLKEFILPGGNHSAASCHLARAICRRAERHYLGLANNAINPLSLTYLNRLSDWLFVLARVLARCDGNKEILWQPRKSV